MKSVFRGLMEVRRGRFWRHGYSLDACSRPNTLVDRGKRLGSLATHSATPPVDPQDLVEALGDHPRAEVPSRKVPERHEHDAAP